MASNDDPPDAPIAAQGENAPAPSSRFAFSTDWLPERDRAAFFMEEVGGKLLRVDVAPLGEAPPCFAMNFAVAGSVSVGTTHITPVHIVRSRRYLSDADDDFNFGLQMVGMIHVDHNGRTPLVGPGEAYCAWNAVPLDISLPVGGDGFVLRIDRATLAAVVRHPEEKAAELYRASCPGLDLLKGYLRAFASAQARMTPELLLTFGRHIVDLVAMVIGPSRDGAAAAEAGGVRAARLAEVLTAIATRASEPGFGINTVAAELGVTQRSIQLLLENTGMTFTEHLIEQRLNRAWQLLTHPLHRDQKVVAIAYDAGFGDVAYFNRVFRRRFGETPTAVRGASATLAPHGREPGTSLPEQLATKRRGTPGEA